MLVLEDVVEEVEEGAEEMTELVDEVDEVDGAGHDNGPHSRSVRQQPPPSETGQALKPVEQARVVCGPSAAAVMSGEAVEEVEVEVEVLLKMLVVEGLTEVEVVDVDDVLVVDDEEVDGGDNVVVTVGVTTSTDMSEGPGPPIN